MARRGKPSLGERKTIVLRIPENTYAELILLHPDLIDPVRSSIRYGAVNSYFLSLVTRDLEARKAQFRKENPHETAA